MPAHTKPFRQGVIGTIWITVASVQAEAGLWISFSLSTLVLASAVVSWAMRSDRKDVEFWMHMAAALLHSGSALALSILVLEEDSNWQSALTRTVSSWQ